MHRRLNPPMGSAWAEPGLPGVLAFDLFDHADQWVSF
jgi:hypothetical protein